MKCCWPWTQIMIGTGEHPGKASGSFQSWPFRLVHLSEHQVWQSLSSDMRYWSLQHFFLLWFALHLLVNYEYFIWVQCYYVMYKCGALHCRNPLVLLLSWLHNFIGCSPQMYVKKIVLSVWRYPCQEMLCAVSHACMSFTRRYVTLSHDAIFSLVPTAASRLGCLMFLIFFHQFGFLVIIVESDNNLGMGYSV
jgi:hypothetical protein